MTVGVEKYGVEIFCLKPKIVTLLEIANTNSQKKCELSYFTSESGVTGELK